MSPVDQVLSPAQAVAVARAERDAGMAAAVAADRGGWDGHVIERALSAFIATGRAFTANDVRDILPEVRSALVGVSFLNAAKAGRIRSVGHTPSTKANTHGHPIRVWQGTADVSPTSDPPPPAVAVSRTGVKGPS